jgi:hypothetical protein
MPAAAARPHMQPGRLGTLWGYVEEKEVEKKKSFSLCQEYIGQITVSTDTVQQLCHSSNLQLQKSAPCTDIHGTQGSNVQILYHKLVPWY